MTVSPNVAVEPGAGPVAGAPPIAAAPSARASILVIDDEAPVRRALSSMLQADGLGVVSAGSGREAVEQSRRRHFDLAVTDLMMPEMDGLQTMAALKAADPDMEVMVLTGHGGMDSAVEALRQGACDYLMKPLTMKQLCTAVEEALERHKRKAPPPPQPAPTSFTQRFMGLGRIRDREAWAYTLVLALAVVMTGSFLHFHIGRLYQEATAQWQARQFSVADDRAQRVSDWLTGRQADAEIISKHPAVQAALQAFHDAGQLPQRPAGGAPELTAALDEMASVYYYNGVYLLDADAHLVAQSQYSEPLSSRLAEISRTVARTGALRPEVLSGTLGKTLVSFSAPVFSRQGAAAGVPITDQPRGAVVLVVDASQTLFPILTRESMPTRTGETLLVRREGDDIIFFSPLRHPPVGSPNLRFPLPTAPLPARIALVGRTTFVEYSDYRHVPVLAATRYIQPAGWGMVNKIDRTEAYENVRQMAVAEVLAAGLLIILLGGLLAYHRRATLMRALKQKEGEFRALLESAPDAMAITDGEGHIVLVNAQAEILFGFKRQELIGRALGMLFPEWAGERSGEGAPSDFSQVAARHAGKTFEMFGLRKGGREFPSEVRLSPVKEIEGGLFSCGIRDITERQQAEKAAQESEAKLQTIFDGVETGILLIDPQTHRIVDANAAALKLIDATRDLVVGARCHKFVCTANEGRCPVTDLGKVVDNSERLLLTVEGARIPIIKTVKPVVIAGRHLLLESFVDISARKQTESALRESEDRYRDLVENSFVLIGTHDAQGRILNVNRAAATLLEATSAEEMAGRPLTDYVPPNLLPQFDDYLKTILQQGHAEGLMVLATPSGKTKIIEYRNTLRRQDPTEPIVRWVSQDVTERIQAEKAQAFLASLVESSQDAIIGKTLEGVIVSWNHGAEKLYGYRAEEIVGKSVSILAPPDRVEELAQLLKKIRQGERISRCETVRVCKDGSLVDASLTISPVCDTAGKITGVVTTARDITERKRAEKALEERTAYLNALIEISPLGIVVLDTEERIQMSNPAFERLFLYSRQELQGANLNELIVPKELIAEGESLARQCVSEGSVHIASRRRRKDGTLVDVEISGVPLVIEGESRGILGLYQDITERKQAEEALAHERDLLRALMNNLPDYLYFKDSESRFLRTNLAHAKTLGLSDPAQAAGKTDFDFFPPEDAKNYYEDEKKVLQTGQPLTGRVESVTQADGEIRWCSTTKVPIRDNQGRVTGLVGITRDITEYKRAEEALRDSEEKFRVLYESSRDAIMMLGPPEWKFIAGNPAAIALFGAKDEQEFVAAPPWRLSPEYQPDGALSSVKAPQMIDAAMKTGSNFFEWTHKKFSGEEFFATVALTRMIYRGQPNLQATVVDITERKRAEEMLQLSQFSMEHASDSIFWMNPQGRIVYVNEGACRTLGRSREELLSLSIPDIDPDVPPEAWKSAWAKVKALGSMNLETHHQTKQGRVFPVEVTSNYLEFAGKEYSFAFARDITERKRAEDETRASEERYRELFENASDIVYTTDMDARFTSFNRVGQQILGYSQEEATQLTLWQLVSPKHWETLKQGRDRLLAGEKEVTSAVEITGKDGRQMVIEAKPRLIYKDGKPVGVQAIARDITGRDAAELELRHAQKLESVGRLASGIAHEINTPIQFVGDNTRFLQESFESFQLLLGKYQELRSNLASGSATPKLLAEVQRAEEASDCAFLLEEVPRAITQTMEGVERVATIVRAMKEFAHPEGREMAAADLNKALQSTLTVARNELKYVADVETDFGELPLVICNVGDLNQVFLNLLVNAAHAIGDVVKGTFAKGKIRVRTQAEGNNVSVTISDTGCGIPEANRPKVFDPFFTTKEVGRGTGQGLAIARTVVVDRHKGALTFESEEGKGTTFHVRLPVDPGECSKETRTP